METHCRELDWLSGESGSFLGIVFDEFMGVHSLGIEVS